MARNDYQLNHTNLENILKSEEVIKLMRGVAEDIVAATGMPETEYEIDEWVGVERARVSIKTVGIVAHVHEARDHNLVRGLGAVQNG